MNTKNLILMLSVVVLGFTSCCNNATKTTATLKTEADTACYYICLLYTSVYYRPIIPTLSRSPEKKRFCFFS